MVISAAAQTEGVGDVVLFEFVVSTFFILLQFAPSNVPPTEVQTLLLISTKGITLLKETCVTMTNSYLL